MLAKSAAVLFSPTDLTTFLGCPHATILDVRQLDLPVLPRAEDSYLELLQIKGLEHEHRYLDALRASGRTVAEIPTDPSLADRVSLTKQAMLRGDNVIYQGALLSEPWHGYSDFLLRVDNSPSELGNFSYEVADTKLARTAKPKHLIQLSVYSTLIAEVQGTLPHAMHVVLGDGSTATFRVQDFLHYCSIARRRLQTFVDDARAERISTEPEPCGHCAFCRWAERCEGEWDAAEHLSLVANINRQQIAKLRDENVNSVRELAAISPDRRVPRMQSATLVRLTQQARLQTHKRDTGENVFELLPLEPGRGFGRLPKPNDGDLFFDIEGDPLFDEDADGGLDYLFGFDYLEPGETAPRFKAFWAHTRSEEKLAFQQLMDFIGERLARFPEAHVYHYASYEETSLKRLAMLHGTRENEVDELLRGQKLVDLYTVVRESIRVSEPRYSIKNIEVFYAPKRTGKVASGGDSVVAYEKWRELRDETLLKQIEAYNEVDCHSTRGCRDWLLSLRSAEVEWFAPQAEVPSEKEVAQTEERREHEARIAALQARLVDGVDETERPWRELLGYLLDFHRREAKHEWWKMFERQKMSTEELIEDRACLGELMPDPDVPPRKEKKSMVHAFRFPPQDFRMKVGDKAMRVGLLKGTDEVMELDEDAGRIALKIGPSRPEVACPMSLIPPGPLNDTILRDSIYRYAEAVADGRADDFAAVTRLLQRVPGPYRLIQGPPGTGKTFTSSHRILDLLAAGKRVGVSSNSHKAIANLLLDVEQHARERGVTFRGIKKSSSVEHFLASGGRIVDTVDNAEAADSSYQLVAGTAWLFARPEMMDTLDYLFIDEAGQVCLANVVAMGTCAKNLVLVGDQMQLSQPTAGVHPGGSGASALEYLLGDMAIVPPDRGEFLGITRRMHPNVCRFVSDAFYEGKLHPEKNNEKQCIAGVPSGLRFVEVEHHGCSQDSDEEAARIREFYDDLLTRRWTNREGDEAPMTPDDILVVSPYNMQVNLLRERLPRGARVGTVDKFQGQQAPAVLVSMAASSGEDIARGIGFLFSRNRLNVAISRARCLTVIFASPRLLEVSCGTTEQMRLVNTLCWARVYAESELKLENFAATSVAGWPARGT